MYFVVYRESVRNAEARCSTSVQKKKVFILGLRMAHLALLEDLARAHIFDLAVKESLYRKPLFGVDLGVFYV